MSHHRIVIMTGALVALLAAPLAAQAPGLKTTELGKGPTIVFLPSLGSQRMVWMPTAKKLLAGRKIVMVDLPGHGDSPMPDPFSFEAAANLLDGVLAKQEPESTIVVAHGVGGLIAVMEAKAHPERMRGVMVVDAGLKSPFEISDQQKKAFVDHVDANYDAFLRQTFKALGRDSAQGVELYSKAALVPSQNVKAYLRQLLDVDGSGAAKNAKVPLLFVGSNHMWPDSLDWAAVAKKQGWENIPQVQTRRIGSGGYLLMADQPDSLAAVIADFAGQAMAKK